MVCLVNDILRLSFVCNEKLTPFTLECLDMFQPIENASNYVNSDVINDVRISQMQAKNNIWNESDAYRDLELHVSGRVVTVATRVHPKSYSNGIQSEDAQDHINVFLTSDEGPVQTSRGLCKDSIMDGAVGSRIPLRTISGLGTTPEEGSCFVYNNSSRKTHVMVKHRTLLVKHIHWHQLGDEVSACEYRSSRGRLPPSKFWLFEPRCGMHDVGGWYVETFGKDEKGRIVPCQRHWDGFDASEQFDKTLHPAMYLLALAYRILDLDECKEKEIGSQ